MHNYIYYYQKSNRVNLNGQRSLLTKGVIEDTSIMIVGKAVYVDPYDDPYE